MKLCKIVKAGGVDKDTEVYVPISDHVSDTECRRAATKEGNGDYAGARINEAFNVKIEKVEKATVTNINPPKAKAAPAEKKDDIDKKK